MLTRIEIDGFKTFERFSLNLTPFTAIVGPNASGKSNLFDALQLLAALTNQDVRSAMKGLRGEPEELFRQTAGGISDTMNFAVEVYLKRKGVDDFGRPYEIPSQRLRYELTLGLSTGSDGFPRGIFVRKESCRPLTRKEDRADFLRPLKPNYNARVRPFISVNDAGDSLNVRQDGRQKHGRPMQLSLKEASRTALSTITTTEFPHLYALRSALMSLQFLEINPRAARLPNDRFDVGTLKPDASNLAAVLARLQEETKTSTRNSGVLADIASDLAALIPSVSAIEIREDPGHRQYSFGVKFSSDLQFSSRVISDGTLRLLALLTILNDPARMGTLCFEEPENGVHEGRIETLVDFLRASTQVYDDPDNALFQVILNTHSPKVMSALKDTEIVAADMVVEVYKSKKPSVSRTRMRRNMTSAPDLFDPDSHLTRAEVARLLQDSVDAA